MAVGARLVATSRSIAALFVETSFPDCASTVQTKRSPAPAPPSRSSVRADWRSPATGWANGTIHPPQGLAFDPSGNLWIPNSGLDAITEYPGGNPAAARVISPGGINRPFAIAVDRQGRVWIHDKKGVTVLSPSGTPVLGSPITGRGLLGGRDIAVDSLGDVWASDFFTRSVTEIYPNGKIAPGSPFRVANLHRPWGIAVDGNDNVWVADSTNHNVTELCGARTSTCPRNDARTGHPISPTSTGFANANLQVITGVQIDDSGNAWAANNYAIVGAPKTLIRPVGVNDTVVFIGVAGPVRTPLVWQWVSGPCG